MFQPQPTPFSSFSAYGVAPGLSDFSFPTTTTTSGGGGVLVLDTVGGPTVFRDPVFSPVGNPGPFHNSSTQPRFKMVDSTTADLEQQEELARSFQPDLKGPLVGDKKSSLAIAEEYAKADPVYVAKTAALPQKYSHYRPILGDGNCGWRAAGFSYFETLLRLGDKARLEEEITRMTSLNNLLMTVGGFESWLFEDMVEETINLLKDLRTAAQDQATAMELIMDRFNNPETSNMIVYHLRLLASSWLKRDSQDAQNYLGFIQDGMGVDGYRKDWLEAPNQEIDHLGMTLLIDVLLKPIGFAVEIVYLDRSEGTQVNSHVMQETDPNGVPVNPESPMIHLLYRPSHYDILYKEQGSSIPLRQNIQVNRATSFSQQHAIQNTPAMNNFSSVDLSTLLSIPGFSLPPPPSHHGFPSQFHIPDFAPSPMNTLSPVSPSAASPASTSSNYPQTSNHTSPSPPFPLTTTQLPLHSTSPVGASSSFRPSKYNWEAATDWQDTPTFQTNTFKNSHFNTAHYNNLNFQPEQWTPDIEDSTSSCGSGRKKSG